MHSTCNASMKTLRLLLVNRAVRLAWNSDRKILRFSSNPVTETLYHQIVTRLAASKPDQQRLARTSPAHAGLRCAAAGKIRCGRGFRKRARRKRRSRLPFHRDRSPELTTRPPESCEGPGCIWVFSAIRYQQPFLQKGRGQISWLREQAGGKQHRTMNSIRCIRGAEGPLESSKRSSFLSGPNQTTMLFVRAAKRADLQERRDWTQSLSTPGNQHWRRRARRAVNLPGNAHHASGDCSMSARKCF